MGYAVGNSFSFGKLLGVNQFVSSGVSPFQNPLVFRCQKSQFFRLFISSCVKVVGGGNALQESETSKLFPGKKGFNFTEEQKKVLSQLPSNMSNRCKALIKQLICFQAENDTVSRMLAAWVQNTKPRRTDWLWVLKELERLNHPLFFKVLDDALTEESFEANARDYTKLIHCYAKQNQQHKAESTLVDMKRRSVVIDQVTLTALVHMYSKAGNLKLAEDSFTEMKLLGVPLDRRSYGSMIMAYIRAGMLDCGENLLREMEGEEIYAGREIYKALLRSYSMAGDSEGAQRVFDSTQLAGIIPDAKVCALLINAYVVSNRTREARIAFDNMVKAGLQPNDKCVALVLSMYEKENNLKEALDFLIELERETVVLGQEASQLLAKWLRSEGIVEEVDLALKDFI